MICPKCSVALSAHQGERPRISYRCEQGHGVAFGFGALKQGFDPAPFTRVWTQAKVSTSGHACPSCRNPMRITDISGRAGSVELDLCKICYLVWLDPGEYESIEDLKLKNPDLFMPGVPEPVQEKAVARAFGAVMPHEEMVKAPDGHWTKKIDSVGVVADVLFLLARIFRHIA